MGEHTNGWLKYLFLIFFVVLFTGACQRDVETGSTPGTGPRPEIPQLLTDQWQEMGPAPIGPAGNTGRVSAIAASMTDSKLYYLAGADGGVWKTTDEGLSWIPLTDHLPTTAIGALAVDPNNHNVVYAGTGEANFANHSRYGLGMYRSTDGGSNWQILAEETFAGRCFSRLIVDPTNTDILYAAITHAGGLPAYRFTIAAAKGHPGARQKLGIWKSFDQGESWQQLTSGLPVDISATDLAADPGNTNILYAAMIDLFGSSRNGIYKTTDSGTTWTKLSGGLPQNPGRIALAIAPSNPLRIFASIVNLSNATGGGASTNGVYRSDDGGTTWAQNFPGNIHDSYGWYLNVITVHPKNQDLIFVGGLRLHRSSNGGNTWQNVWESQHVDLHALCFDASLRLLAGNDGGIYRSNNDGQSWTILNNGLGLVQFYAGISLDSENPTTIYGGTQDNGTLMRTGIGKSSWMGVLGGDGGYTAISPQNSQIVFAEKQGTGELYKSENRGTDFTRAARGFYLSDPNCFLPPFVFNPNNSKVLYYATNRVYRSRNEGEHWDAMSGDLTSGGGAAIRSLSISSSNPDILYVGTNDGRILASFDEAGHWSLIRENVSGWPRVMRQLAVAQYDPLSLYLVGSSFNESQIMFTADGGKNWDLLGDTLPDIPANAIALDSRFVPRKIYVGTDAGVFSSSDNGITWSLYGSGLPNCPVNDIIVDTTYNRMIAATQGRGMWQIGLQSPD